MANPTIKTRGWFSSHYLEVTILGIRFHDSGVITFGPRKISFSQVECVLMSPSSVLSIQVGQEVLTIPVNQQNPKHRQAIDALLAGLRQGNG